MQYTILVFACLCLLALLPGCERLADPIPVEAGVSRELARERRSHLTNLRYALDINIPRERHERLRGHATIRFDWKPNAQPIVIDFRVPTADYLRTVSIGGEPVEYRFEQGHIVLDPSLFEAGNNAIELEFDLGDQSLNRQDDFLYTLFVPDRAATAIPLFDQPDMKARFTLRLTLPAAWEALANGRLQDSSVQDRTKTLVFVETEPIPTYLFHFVAGEFRKITRSVAGRSMTMLHRETDLAAVARNVDEIFRLHGVAVDWLEDYTGIPLPFSKLDFALIPAFQYGGMEHPGAITYKAASLMLDANATATEQLGRASLIAHETAHMWFGDLVTMTWFDDVWMKEVFANFMAAKIVNPSFPDINHELRFLLAHYPLAYAVDRSEGTHPIQQPLDNLRDAGTLYGSIIYQKAPIVMRMLERKIGEEALRRGLQQYLSTYSYGNASWDDLIAILNEQTPDDLEAWNRQWIKQAGMPQVATRLDDYRNGRYHRLVVEQLNARGEQQWSQPLTVGLLKDTSAQLINLELDASEVSISDSIGFLPPQLLVPNADGYGYGYFPLDSVSKNFWLSQINRVENPLLRGVGWLTLRENFLHGQLATEAYLATLLSGVSTEDDPLLLQRILSDLQNLYWKFLPTEARASRAAAIETTLWNRLGQTTDPRAKTALFNTYRDIALSPTATRRLLAFWQTQSSPAGLSLSENDFTTLALELAVRGVGDSLDLIGQQVERLDNPDRRARLRFIAPALAADTTVRDSFFNSLSREENRAVESWVQDALGYLHHPLRADHARKYVLPTLELLETLQATGDIFFPKAVLDQTFSGHRSPVVVRTVRDFLDSRKDYPANLRAKILQAADLTFRAAAL